MIEFEKYDDYYAQFPLNYEGRNGYGTYFAKPTGNGWGNGYFHLDKGDGGYFIYINNGYRFGSNLVCVYDIDGKRIYPHHLIII